MKLRALELEQFRKFAQPVRLDGFGDRINVLCGPNEFGKSTILAAIRSLMFERHTSKADPIKRMQNLGGNAAPLLAMEFETGDGLWRIEKRFLHQPMARLTAPDGGRFDGEAAEEELQRLLGFGASGKQGARQEQMGVWGALWVTQRESVLQADLTTQIARSTITGCLDAEVGVLTGKESGQALIRAVREQRARLLDGNGKPRDRYAQVLRNIVAHEATIQSLRLRSEKLAANADELRQAERTLAKLDDPAKRQQDASALQDAQARRDRVERFEEALNQAGLKQELAATRLREARHEQETRLTSAANLVAAQQKSALAAAAKTAATVEADTAGEDFGRYLAKLAEAERRVATANTALRAQRTLAEIVRRRTALARLEKRLEQADEACRNKTEIESRIEAMPVDQGVIDRIRKTMRDRDAARSALLSQATRVDFHLLPGAASRVTVAGMPVAGSLDATEDLAIAIEDVGFIQLRPAIKDRSRLVKAADNAEDAVRDALLASRCADAEAAEAAHSQRELLARNLADASASLSRLVAQDEEEGLAAGLDILRGHVGRLRAHLDLAVHAQGDMALPRPADAGSLLAAAEAELEAASEAQEVARADRDAAAERRSVAGEHRARAEMRAEGEAAEVQRIANAVDVSVAKESDEALAARLALSAQALGAAHKALETLEAGRPQDTISGMSAMIERYQNAIENRRNQVQALRETIIGLRTIIVQEGGQGLDEDLAATQRDQDALLQERDGLALEAAVTKLLLDTLLAAETSARQQYLEPVRHRVTPYLRSLFPGADIHCDDTLRITGLTRDILGKQDFERLSDGTQEQIAVLSRLAFAEMLIDQGKPAMVILDDALAYADADRMERMFDVLTQASAKTQILVLTCREDLFARLGGNRIVVTSQAGVRDVA